MSLNGTRKINISAGHLQEELCEQTSNQKNVNVKNYLGSKKTLEFGILQQRNQFMKGLERIKGETAESVGQMS